MFTRSFSALVIVQILIKDMENKFLTDEILLQTIEASIKYLKLEEDTRGFVDGKGWAHSIAHGADLLTAAIRHSNFNNGLSSECLEAIKLCLFKDDRKDSPYIDEEEERLIFAVEALQEKGISNREISKWVVSISDQLADLLEKEGHSINFFRKKNNVINFLRAYYFRLLYKNDSIELREKIVTILNDWYRKMYNK